MGDTVTTQPEDLPSDSEPEKVDDTAPDARAQLAALDETVAVLAAELLGGF